VRATGSLSGEKAREGGVMPKPKIHYFYDDGYGWIALCGRISNYLNYENSSFGTEDVTCEICRGIIQKRGIVKEMHPETAWLILRRAISATETQFDLALKVLAMDHEKIREVLNASL